MNAKLVEAPRRVAGGWQVDLEFPQSRYQTLSRPSWDMMVESLEELGVDLNNYEHSDNETDVAMLTPTFDVGQDVPADTPPADDSSAVDSAVESEEILSPVSSDSTSTLVQALNAEAEPSIADAVAAALDDPPADTEMNQHPQDVEDVVEEPEPKFEGIGTPCSLNVVRIGKSNRVELTTINTNEFPVEMSRTVAGRSTSWTVKPDSKDARKITLNKGSHLVVVDTFSERTLFDATLD